LETRSLGDKEPRSPEALETRSLGDKEEPWTLEA